MNMIQKINDEWTLNSRLILCFHECNEFHLLHSFLFSTSCIHECTTISQSVNEDFSIILDFSATLINPVIVVWYFLCRKSIYKAHNLWQLSKCAKMKTHKKNNVLRYFHGFSPQLRWDKVRSWMRFLFACSIIWVRKIQSLLLSRPYNLVTASWT